MTQSTRKEQLCDLKENTRTKYTEYLEGRQTSPNKNGKQTMKTDIHTGTQNSKYIR